METWLRASGARGLDNLSLADFPLTGRGVLTSRQFTSGEEILTIPRSALWTVDHAYADPVLGPALRGVKPALEVDDVLVAYLLFVRSLSTGGGQEGHDEGYDERYDGRRRHIAALPKEYTSSLFFNEDELDICGGSSLEVTTRHLKVQVERDYEGLVERLFGKYRGLFPEDRTTIDDYKWALCTVWSRAMDFQLQDGKSLRLIAPFADMLNHDMTIEGQCHAYDPREGTLTVLAGRRYEAGEQVFINYGSVPNNRLSRLYGFVIPSNPHDCYELVLTTQPSAPLFTQKQQYWQSVGLDSTSRISLTLKEPLPKTLLQYLRIQRLSSSDLAEIVLARRERQGGMFETAVNDDNEVEILTALVESIGAILEGFRIEMEVLEERVEKGVYTPGNNAWAAAVVSIGEQKVLRAAKREAGRLLLLQRQRRDLSETTNTTARCSNCGMTDAEAKLMRCGRCNRTAYCGRTCQVAHWKVHKTGCKK